MEGQTCLMLALGSMLLIGAYTVFVRAPKCLWTISAIAAAAEVRDQDVLAPMAHLGDLTGAASGVDYLMVASDEGIFLGVPEERGNWRCVDVNRVAERTRHSRANS